MQLFKITRLRWRTKPLVLYTVFLLVIVYALPPAVAGAKPKPRDDVEYGSEGDVSETFGQSDDIYEPSLLQEEVQASERRERHQNEDDTHDNDDVVEEEEAMQQTTTRMRKIPNNHIENSRVTNDHENMTEERDVPLRRTSSEEYYDDSHEAMVNVKKRQLITTTLPEYVKRSKSERPVQPSSSSVYIDETAEQSEGALDQEQSQRRKKTFVEQRSRKKPSHSTQDEVDEDVGVQKFERKHKHQQLPRRQNAKNFNSAPVRTLNYDESQDDAAHDVDDEYYDEEEFYEKNQNKNLNQRSNNASKQRKTTLPPLDDSYQNAYQQETAPERTEQNEIENKTAKVAADTSLSSSSPSSSSSLPSSSVSSLSWSTLMNSTETKTPLILYDTTLSTPLALGAFKTTTASATGFPSVIPATTDTLVQATTASIATTTTTTTPGTTNTMTPTTTTTTLRPGSKRGKQINIARRKLQPHEKLRNYIEDAYIRMPLAVIVDPSSESLEKTKALWRDALRTNFNIKIVLVSLNASGMPSAYSFNNTRQFLAGLNSIKEHAGGDAFIGIVHASEIVPYDSAVFISTASLPPHTELVQDAAITLLKKRIRLYLLWFGERSVSENETQEAVGGILGEVAIRSGGDILHIVGSENSQELEGGNTLVLVSAVLHGPQEIEIPVDTTLSSLHVKIDAPTRSAVLETPNGDINLKKLIKLRSHLFLMDSDDKSLDAYVPLTKLRKFSVFTLKIIPKSLETEYDVFVRADRKPDHFLEDMIKRFDAYFLDGVSYNPLRFRESRLRSIKNVMNAIPRTHEDIKFPDNSLEDNKTEFNVSDEKKTGPKSEIETFSPVEIHKYPNEIETLNATAEINRNNFQAAESQQQQARGPLHMSITKIEMGAQSQVLVAPGTTSQLFFEVTNTRAEPVYHNIQVVDERRFLLRLIPPSIFLRPGETATVTVTLTIPQGTLEGTIDRITFTCHGSGTASLSVNLKVTTSLDAKDTVPPAITWSFGSRCDYVAADSPSCSERFWTLDITAQDWETGILRLQSTPANRLFYRNSYTVGSTEPLKATYAATCCEPKVSLIAFDVAGNQRSYHVDVRDIVLTEATIAAIVLGVLLLIVIIILVIWGIVYCCRRRKIVLDLPTYRSHSTRSME